MIIAVKDKERVVLGYSNLQSMSKFLKKDYVDEENVPIKISSNGNVFAFGRLSRESDLFLYDKTFLEMEITPKTIVREVIPYIKQRLEENGCPIKDGEWKNNLIISADNRIYCIDTAFEFFEAYDYHVFSYSSDEFMAVLDETAEMNPEQRITNAVSFIEEIYSGELFPMVILDTKSKKIKPIYEGGLDSEHNFSI